MDTSITDVLSGTLKKVEIAHYRTGM